MTFPAWTFIAQLEATSSKNEKLDIIGSTVGVPEFEQFFEGARMALDPLITFGIKKIPSSGAVGGSGLGWEEFNGLCTELRTKDSTKRRLSGNAARDRIEHFMKKATTDQWNGWYRRILIKDLRCGSSEKSFNKVIKAKDLKIKKIREFTCQLAHDSKNHENKMEGKKFIDFKLDGVRGVLVIAPDEVVMFSRNGKVFENFTHINTIFEELKHKITEPMVLDGEITSKSFQALMTQTNRRSNVKAGDAVFNVFDILPLSEFKAGKSKKTQAERFEQLAKFWDEHDLAERHSLAILDHELVDLDTAEGRKRYNQINMTAIDLGLEGIMIKDPDAFYITKRATAWMKLKPTITVDLKAVGFEEGTGKNAGMLGAIEGVGFEDGKEIETNVGTGLSDDQRKEFWANRRKLVGFIFEVEADAITLNSTTGKHGLRFPRFVRWRGFVPGEKI